MHEESNHTQNAAGLHIGLVVSRYHDAITSALREGAIEAFVQAGGAHENLVIVNAPGAFEIPLLADQLAARPDIHAVVACGCVITGETTHDQFINQAVSSTLAHCSIKRGKPIAFGMLTCQSIDQARERAGGSKGNKGAEAMKAAIETCRTVAAIRSGNEAEGAKG